jgi:hypothetical protein
MESSNIYSEKFKKLIKNGVVIKDDNNVYHLSTDRFEKIVEKCVADEWCPEILDEDGRQNMDTWAINYRSRIFYGDDNLIKEVYNNVHEGKGKHKTFENFEDYLRGLYSKLHDKFCDEHAREHYYNFPEEDPGHLNGLRKHPSTISDEERIWFLIEKGDFEEVQYLIDNGININIRYEPDGNWSLLHHAANSIATECIDILIKAGVDVNNIDNKGKTPLMDAVDYGEPEHVKMLLHHGADINIVDNDGKTALMIELINETKQMSGGSKDLLLNATYNDIADKVLNSISKQDMIFDTAFIIFKKKVQETIPNEYFDIDNKDIQDNLYNIFQENFSKFNKL